MSSPRRMPDGSLCWSGASCRRHGTVATRTAKKEALKLVLTAPFNAEAKAKRNDVMDDFIKELRDEVNKKYVQLYEIIRHDIPENVEDEQLPDMKAVRRGLNAPEDLRKKVLDFEGLVTRSEVLEEDQKTIEYYSGSSHEYINAYLRKGEDGIRGLSYLRDRNTGIVPEETVERYVGMAEKSIQRIDTAIDNNQRPLQHKRVLWRSIGIKPEQRNGKPLHEYVAEKYHIGAKITSKAYESTSADSDLMLAYRNTPKKQQELEEVVFEILTNKGIVIHNPVTDYVFVGDSEREVLLPRNMKYEVVNVGEVTFETTYASGRPQATAFMSGTIPKKTKKLVVQLKEIDN